MSTKPAVQKPSQLASYMAVVILAILMLLPFHAFFTTWAGANFGHYDEFRIWKEVVILGLGLGCAALLVQDRSLRHRFFGSKLVILITLYVVMGFLRTAYGYSQDIVSFESMAYGVIGAFRYLVFFLVVWLVASKSRLLQRWWPFAVIGPATIVVMFGLLQQFILDKNFLTHFGYGPDSIPAFQGVDQKTEYARAQSTLRGPNPLGAYLVLVITFLTGMFYKLKAYRFSFGFLLVAASVLLFFSYSRSAWIGLAISLAVFILLAVKSKKVLNYLLIFGVIGAVLGASVVYIFRDNDYVQNTVFHTDENSQSATSSNTVRTQAIQDGLDDIVENPLGQGLGSAGPASTRGQAPKIAENYYIQVAQETGVFGLILYLAITVSVGYQLYKKRRQLLPQLLLATLIGISVINLVSHAWMDDTLSLMWWGLAGISMAGVFEAGKTRERPKKE